MTPSGPVDERQLGALCSLDDPTRRRLYTYVTSKGVPVTRDQASEELGIERSTVAYHLDRLLDDGLLVASFARPAGRGGPGAGRPAKRYQRADTELAVSVPPRDYLLVAEVLARAAEADDTGTVRRTVDQVAGELGQELMQQDAADLFEQLRRHGFEPYADGDVIRLRNCPFHRLARAHRELVCSLNLALLTGAVDASGAHLQARLDPAEARCCVAFQPVTLEE